MVNIKRLLLTSLSRKQNRRWMEDNSTSADPLSDTTNGSRVDLGSLAPLSPDQKNWTDGQASNSSSKEVEIWMKGGR